jgi:hypothetical protein
MAQRTLASGNTIGARFWTDGKMEAPMLPDQPALQSAGIVEQCYGTKSRRK